MVREPQLSATYFENAILYYEERVEKLEGYIDRKDDKIPNWSRIFSGLSEAHLHLFFNKYSLGRSIGEIIPHTHKALEFWIKAEEDEGAEEARLKEFFGIYDRVLWLACFCAIFDIEQAAVEHFKKIIDDRKGKDRLLDLILQSRLPGIKPAAKLVYPKTFEPLVAIFDQDVKERPGLMKSYLDGWYKGMRKASWYNTHKLGEEARAFFGYWSVEAATVTCLLEIEDSDYENAKYYPQDLADYCKK